MDAVNIFVNGEPLIIDADATVRDLISRLGYDAKGVAVAVNGEFVSRSNHANCQLKMDDRVDIVTPMQGG